MKLEQRTVQVSWSETYEFQADMQINAPVGLSDEQLRAYVLQQDESYWYRRVKDAVRRGAPCHETVESVQLLSLDPQKACLDKTG